MKKLGLLEVLEGIEDSRRERSVWYPLHEVLFIFIAAVICGATSYVKVEMFGKSKEKWLKKYIQLENGVPDACTFRNVVKAIDTQQLHTVFIEWMKEAVESISGVVAVDGKQARRTKDAKKRALHVVSAFSAECGLVLGQLACEEKSNEITAIPKLLEQLELKGCIVTIDAMGTQSEIASAITNKGADYILSLKENQPGLYRDVKLYFEEYRGIRQGCLPHAAPRAIVRGTDALRAGAVTSAKIFHGWRGGRNGLICRGSALFSLKQRKTGRNQSRHTTSSIAAKE